MIRKICLVLLFVCMMPLTGMAQDKVEANFEVTMLSKYIWRGLPVGGVSLQPSATLSWKGAYVNLEGNKGFNKEDIEELDVNIGYKFPFGLNIGVSDLWQSDSKNLGQYFLYKEGDTSHTFEGNIGFSCRFFDLQAYCMFWGDDYKTDGTRAYSTYIELAVPFKLGGLEWTATAAMTPMESAGGYSTLYDEDGKDIGWERNFIYADGPACVLASLRAEKNLHCKKFDLPVFVELNANPYLKKAAFLAGVTIKAF